MTAEFTSDGFSAVASFFGQKEQKTKTEDNNNEVNSSSSKKKKHYKSRSGVGSSSSTLKHSLSLLSPDQTAKKRILSVGNKRKRNNNDDDDDDDDNGEDSEVKGTQSGGEIEKSDDEDHDEGRTSAIKQKTIKDSNITEIAMKTKETKTKKKKKKKSKKERLREAETDVNKSKDSEKMGGDKGVTAEGQDKKDLDQTTNDPPTETEIAESVEKDQNGNDTIDDAKAQNLAKTKSQKGKRRRVRSKQKNVRKDTRNSNQKPDHLKLGSATYRGRPLTKETRSFMNMPESRTSSIRREKIQLKDSNKDLNTSEDDIELTKLGIDDLLGDDEKDVSKVSTETGLDTGSQNNSNENDDNDDLNDSGVLVSTKDVQGIEKSTITSIKQKKKKKSKYKNLR